MGEGSYHEVLKSLVAVVGFNCRRGQSFVLFFFYID